MAKGDIPNTNTMSSANSVNQKMQPTGNQMPWQQMAMNNSSYPTGIVQQNPLGPYGSGGLGGFISNLFHQQRGDMSNPMPMKPMVMKPPMTPMPTDIGGVNKTGNNPNIFNVPGTENPSI